MPTLIEEIGVKQGEKRRGHRPGPGEVGDAYPDLQVRLEVKGLHSWGACAASASWCRANDFLRAPPV